MAQVPGGPGPYRLRAWISTLDPAKSATVTGVHVGLLVSRSDDSGFEVAEDPESPREIAGRTWHLFSGQIHQPLSLGGWVYLEFPASANTWLVQAPEFIPKALLPAEKPRASPAPRALARPPTEDHRGLVDRYRREPKVSVPAGHPAMSDGPQGSLRP